MQRPIYAIGVYMAGAGYNLAETYVIAQRYSMSNSSTWYKYWRQGKTLDQERLGGCPSGVLENEMKRGWIVLLAAPFVALGAIVWAFLPAIFVLVKFAMEPAGRGCDEGPVTDQCATNARGDVVEEYIRACTGFGTVVDYSIVMQLRGDEKTTKLVETREALLRISKVSLDQ
jgi:hypothetical protein